MGGGSTAGRPAGMMAGCSPFFRPVFSSVSHSPHGRTNRHRPAFSRGRIFPSLSDRITLCSALRMGVTSSRQRYYSPLPSPAL